MKGIKLQPSPGPFGVCFQDILPLVEPLHWISDNQSFHFFPLEELSDWDDATSCYTQGPMIEVEAQQEQVVGPENHGHSGLVLKPSFLPRYAEYVLEDWNTLAGFRSRPQSVIEHLKANGWPHFEAFAELIEDKAEIYFHNVDGAFWLMFARDPEYIRKVQERFNDKSERVFKVYSSLRSFLDEGQS